MSTAVGPIRHVFISYKREDQDRVARLVQALETNVYSAIIQRSELPHAAIRSRRYS
jgi:hypothetical protein